MGSAADWHALLDEFRGFGGKAENVMQRKGEFGMGLFPIDSSKTIELTIPNRLLIEADNLELSGGEITIKDASTFPDGYAEWFRHYQNNYSWGAEGRQKTLETETGLKSLPQEVQKILKINGLYNPENRFPEKDKDQEVFQRFLQTRVINSKVRRVIMPIVELINHSPSADTWGMSSESISVSGLYENEVLVNYSISDPLRRFLGYGFNSHEPAGFSLSMRLKHRNQNILVRGGILNQNVTRGLKVEAKDESLVIFHPLLASSKSPKMPRTLFLKAFQKFDGVEADELFEQIHHRNTLVIVQILRLLNKVEGETAGHLRTACLDQLAALSFHIGKRSDILDQATAITD